MLGVSEESKAYRLYDPITKKITISRDVIFEEDAIWDWKLSKPEEDIFTWGDDGISEGEETDEEDVHEEAEPEVTDNNEEAEPVTAEPVETAEREAETQNQDLQHGEQSS